MTAGRHPRLPSSANPLKVQSAALPANSMVSAPPFRAPAGRLYRQVYRAASDLEPIDAVERSLPASPITFDGQRKLSGLSRAHRIPPDREAYSAVFEVI